MKEKWRDIPTYEGLYQASNLGRIKSLARVTVGPTGKTQTVKERILKSPLDSGDYCLVNLRKNNKTKSYRVHALVVWAFMKLAPGDYQHVCHRSGIKRNNKLSNLRPDSQFGNMADTDRHGTSIYNKRAGKLSPITVGKIRQSKLDTETLSKRYNISTRHLVAIRNNTFWNPDNYIRILKRQIKYYKIYRLKRTRIAMQETLTILSQTSPGCVQLNIAKGLLQKHGINL